MPTIAEAPLRAAISLILERSGSSKQEADTVTDHLVRANLAGHDSHGVGMIPNYMHSLSIGQLFANKHVKLIKDEPSIMMFDGQRGYGQVQAKESMEQALLRAKENGLVLMTLKNAHHIGRVGTYGEMSIAAGMVSLHFVNVTNHEPKVAPYGGIKARFVTNPVCIAMPGTSQTESILLDMATSKIALGKARVAMNKGVDVPEHSLLDASGNATNNPNVMFGEPQGVLLPFGDYKGSGLALFCELLAGGLSGGGTIQPENKREGGIVNNMLSLIVDPARLVDTAWLAHEVDTLIAYVKNTPAQVQTGPVKVAGDPERITLKGRQAKGIPVAEAAWQGILEAGRTVGVRQEEFDALI